VDALLLCRCGAHFLARWRAAVRHHIEYHQGHLQDGPAGKPPPYQAHEQPRLYGVSTRKNRTA
jgi:hypothetical protein